MALVVADSPAEELRMTFPPVAPKTPIEAWWSTLSSGRQRLLLLGEAGELLPRSLAIDLWRNGISCPLTLIDDHGRLVQRALAPPALLTFLADIKDTPAPQAEFEPVSRR